MQEAMTLESWKWGDPAKVLERKQEAELRMHRACGDCVHRRSIEFKGEIGNFCEFKKKVYGVRCELYKVVKL